MSKVDTIDLKGKDYATVPARLKKFREECPRGSIVTSPAIQDDGKVLFTAKIIKDKSDPSSAEATGHSLSTNPGEKDFEKQETIAVGRALAMLGYLASGEVASSEEMEEFYAHKQQQRAEAIALAIEGLEDAKTLDELKQAFTSLGNVMAEPEVIAAKDKRKEELSKVLA